MVRWRTVGDDGAGLGRDLELLGGELEHRGEGRRLWHAEPAGIQSGWAVGRAGSGPGPATTAIEVEGGIRSVGARADYSHFERELGVGGEDDLEGHLPSSARRAAARRRHGLPRREASRLA